MQGAPLTNNGSGKDFYAILGVERDASKEEVKQAFKVKARELHPDKNLDNPSAKEEFQAVSEAYNVLKDPEKRRLYDLGTPDDQISILAEPDPISEFLRKVFGIRMVDPHDENDKLELTGFNKLMWALCCLTCCCWLPFACCLCCGIICCIKCCAQRLGFAPPEEPANMDDFDDIENQANNAGNAAGNSDQPGAWTAGPSGTAGTGDTAEGDDEQWTYERLDALSVSVLKAILEGRNVDYNACVEKSDLVKCALRTLNPTAAANL